MTVAELERRMSGHEAAEWLAELGILRPEDRARAEREREMTGRVEAGLQQPIGAAARMRLGSGE